jgi:hypothetical protein
MDQKLMLVAIIAFVVIMAAVLMMNQPPSVDGDTTEIPQQSTGDANGDSQSSLSIICDVTTTSDFMDTQLISSGTTKYKGPDKSRSDMTIDIGGAVSTVTSIMNGEFVYTQNPTNPNEWMKQSISEIEGASSIDFDEIKDMTTDEIAEYMKTQMDQTEGSVSTVSCREVSEIPDEEFELPTGAEVVNSTGFSLGLSTPIEDYPDPSEMPPRNKTPPIDDEIPSLELYTCGDGKCEISLGESCKECQQDCNPCECTYDEEMLSFYVDMELQSLLSALQDKISQEECDSMGVLNTRNYYEVGVDKYHQEVVDQLNDDYGAEVEPKWCLIEADHAFSCGQGRPTIYRISYVVDSSTSQVVSNVWSVYDKPEYDALVENYNTH